jgi:hypothetical protein
VAADSLWVELKTLRKGFGLNDSRPADDFGPAVRRVCRVTDADDAWTIRDKVRKTLERLSHGLAEPHRTVSLAVLGLSTQPDARYNERLKGLASKFDRNPRTMQRRSDAALRLLAERLFAEDRAEVLAPSRVPWHTRALRTTLLLDEPGVEAIEARRISSHVDGLREIRHSVTVASPDRLGLPGLRIRAISGGDVTATRLVAANRAELDFRLSRPLAAHDEHEIEFRVLVPAMSPFYVCTPIYPCDLFDLRIRFDRSRPPTRIWVVDGALAHEADDPTVDRTTIEVDTSGEVRHVFHNLVPYRSYGLLWHPAPG